MKSVFLSLLFSLITVSSFSQNNRIEGFPYYGQDWDIPNEPNDCGPWAVGSILAYWTDNLYLCNSRFDRFIDGSSVWESNSENVRFLIEKLKDALPYGSWLVDIFTNPIGLGSAIEGYCNNDSFSNNYDFVSNSTVITNQNAPATWELIKDEIDNGRPVLLHVVGKCDIYREWRNQWENLPELVHYMPVIG